MTIGNCDKCNGTGSVGWARHYADGVCFKCDGTGKAEIYVADAAADERFKVAGLRQVMHYSDCYETHEIEANMVWVWAQHDKGVAYKDILEKLDVRIAARQAA